LIWHVVAWRKLMREHLKGNSDYDITLNSGDDWIKIDEGDATTWENTLAELKETQNTILDLLAQAKESTLQEPYKKKYSRSFLIGGVIQHDIYHLGQIRMIASLVGENRNCLLSKYSL
jgi:uncharacterized damage-inducible protein DinB